MQGKVLGFDAAAGTGVIRGEDDKRYDFKAADWKGAEPAQAGAGVDFEASGGSARDIYPTRGLNIDLSDLGETAAGLASSDAAKGFLASWSPIIAIVSLILTILPFAVIGDADPASLYGVLGPAIDLKRAIADLDGAGLSGALLSAYPALYLIPLSALWVVAFGFMSRSTRLPALVHGWVSVGLPFLLVLVANMLLPDDADGRIDFGWAGLLILLVGVVQLLVAYGAVKGGPGRLGGK